MLCVTNSSRRIGAGFSALVMLMSISMVGCSVRKTIPVHGDAGAVNFEYTPQQQQPPTNLTISIISPEFAKVGPRGKGADTGYSRFRDPSSGSSSRSRFTFSKDRQYQLTTAIDNSLMEMFSKKGFKTAGPFSSFDDLTYGEKKQYYLAAVPTLYYSTENEVLSDTCDESGIYCTREGEMRVVGEFNIRLKEPLTGQTFLNKRINLSNLSIHEPYIQQYQRRFVMHRWTEVPESLKDNRKGAKTNALNRFFKLASEKVQLYLSREELLSFSDDIAKLKGLKRF